MNPVPLMDAPLTQLSTRLHSSLSPALSGIIAAFQRHRLAFARYAYFRGVVELLNRIVEVRDTQVGYGVFALRQFPRHAMIGTITGRLMDAQSHSSDYCMDFSDSHSLEPDAPFRFLNHSCLPNCELVVLEADDELPAEMALFAIRDLAMHEELTIDYGWPADHAIPCLCGADQCRLWIVCPEELELVAGIRQAESDENDGRETEFDLDVDFEFAEDRSDELHSVDELHSDEDFKQDGEPFLQRDDLTADQHHNEPSLRPSSDEMRDHSSGD